MSTSIAGFSASKSNATNFEQQLTMARAAELLDTSERTVRRWIARGELRAYRYGPRLIRIDAADLRAFREEVNPVTFAHVKGGGRP